jgi:glycine oxidase
MSEHIAIIGGGIVGCMTAMALKKQGYQVTVVERNQIASQTSGESSWAGGGIVFPLLPWFYAEPVNQLTSYGAKAYTELCHELESETGLSTDRLDSGFLILPPFDEQVAQQWCETHQQRYEMVETKNPLLAAVGRKALWLPEVCQIRPPFFMKALKAWLIKHGVTLLEHTELIPPEALATISAWKTTDGREICADRYVVTSGAWSYLLLRHVAKQLDIKPMRGQIILYAPTQNLQEIVYQDGFYMIPRQDGYLLAGSTLEDVGFDTTTTESARMELIQKAQSIMPSLQGLPVIKHWSGLRPGTPHNMPIISTHPSIDNLYLNTGHFRYGLSMAPASARLISEIMMGQPPFLDVSPFKLALSP